MISAGNATDVFNDFLSKDLSLLAPLRQVTMQSTMDKISTGIGAFGYPLHSPPPPAPPGIKMSLPSAALDTLHIGLITLSPQEHGGKGCLGGRTRGVPRGLHSCHKRQQTRSYVA